MKSFLFAALICLLACQAAVFLACDAPSTKSGDGDDGQEPDADDDTGTDDDSDDDDADDDVDDDLNDDADDDGDDDVDDDADDDVDDDGDDDVDDDLNDDVDDDIVGEFNASLEFLHPDEMQPNTAYEFEFLLTNTTLPSADTPHWIDKIKLLLPGPGYEFGSIYDPDAAGPWGGEWEHNEIFDADENLPGVEWAFHPPPSNDHHGDITEGNWLEFVFRAKADDLATDGFAYVVFADSGRTVAGTAFVASSD